MMEAINDVDKLKFLGNTREQEFFKLGLQTAFVMNKKHLQEFKEELKKEIHNLSDGNYSFEDCEDDTFFKVIDTQMQKHFGGKLNGN